MKKLLISLLVIVGLLAGVPLLFSIKASDAYDLLASQVETSGQFILQKDNYKRGYFSSSSGATVKINWDSVLSGRMDKMRDSLEVFDFRVSHDILHGPFPRIMQGNFRPAQALIITRLDLTDEAKDKLSSLFPDGHPVVFSSWIEFSGDSQTEISASSFEASNQGGTLVSQGLQGTINFFSSQTRIQSQLDMPLLSFQSGKGENIKFAGLKLTADTLPDASGINIGDMSFSIDEISVTSTPQSTNPLNLKLGKLKANSAARITGNKLLGITKFIIKDLVFSGQQFGPVNYEISVDNIDVDIIKQIQQAMDEIQQSDMPDEQKQMMVAGKMMSLLPALLQSGPTMDIKEISFHFNNEITRLQAELRINPDLLIKDAPPVLLLQALDVDAHITLPKALLAALPQPKPRLALSADSTVTPPQKKPGPAQRMERLTQQGFFNTDGRYYRSRILFKQGRLTLNGQEFNPMQAMQ